VIRPARAMMRWVHRVGRPGRDEFGEFRRDVLKVTGAERAPSIHSGAFANQKVSGR
jgi:hypothetical protein